MLPFPSLGSSTGQGTRNLVPERNTLHSSPTSGSQTLMQMFIQITVKVSPCSCQTCPSISELLQWTLRDTSLIASLKAQGRCPRSSVSKESACNTGDPGSIPGPGRSPGEGNGNPLQYSCLENLMDWGACRKESDTTERLHFTSLDLILLWSHSVFRERIHKVIYFLSWQFSRY